MDIVQRNNRVSNTTTFETDGLTEKEISLVYGLQQLHLQMQATAADIKNKNIEIETVISK